MKKRESNLSAEIFLETRKIFYDNGWKISSFDKLFSDFCDRLSVLKLDEQRLVLDLTKHFLKISDTDYTSYMEEVFADISHIRSLQLSNIKRILILPLLAPWDFRKNKSSAAVWYVCKGRITNLESIFSSKRIVFLDYPIESEKLTTISKDDVLILVDDYVGSGETAIGAIKHINKNFGINMSNIIVASIASQNLGISSILQETGCQVFSKYKLPRGISDNYSGDKLRENIVTMKNIEQFLRVEKENQFGYGKSEGLISLINTPNNTFPVFWQENKGGSKAPFKRVK